MKRALLPLALAATAALLWQSATPARACSCVYSNTAEFVDFADRIVIGRLHLSDQVSGAVLVSVETYLKGSGSAEVAVGDLGPGDCSYRFGLVDGSRHVLLLRVNETGLSTSSCSGSVRLDGDGDSDFAQQRLREIIAITGEGTPPADVEEMTPVKTGDAPTIPLAVAAVAIPLLFLLAASFAFPAKGSRA